MAPSYPSPAVGGPEPARPLRAAVYARISLDRSGEGQGVARQTEDCAKLIADRGWLHVATFRDNSISAHSGKRRPGYEAMMRTVEAGEIEAIVAWNPDRLHRQLLDLEAYARVMEDTNCLTVLVRGGEMRLNEANGRLVARLLGSVAVAESEIKGERVKRRRAQEAQQGRAHGPLGYGYRRDQSIEPDEREVVIEVAERLLAGETLYSVAADLTGRGVPSPGAGRWNFKQIGSAITARPHIEPLVTALRSDHPTSQAKALAVLAQAGVPARRGADVLTHVAVERWLLENDRAAPDGQIASVLTLVGVAAPPTSWRASNLGVMIRRGALCGWRDFGPGGRGGRGEMVAQGSWTPILAKETTEALRSLLDSRKSPMRSDGRPVGGRPAKFLLSGVLVCGRCGQRLSGYTDAATGLSKYSCTRVLGTARCGRLSIAGPVVEEAVVAAVKAALVGARLRPTVGSTARTGAEDEAAATETILRIRADIETYTNMAKKRQIGPEEYLEIHDGLREELRRAEKLLGGRAVDMRADLQDVPTGAGELNRWWEQATVSRRRQVIRAIVERVPVATRNDTSNAAGRSRRDKVLARLGTPIWRA